MPMPPLETLCTYAYDALDQLSTCAFSRQESIQRFYCKTRLTTEVLGSVQRSIMLHEGQPLAQRQCEGAKVDTTLLATDQQRSVLHAVTAASHSFSAYTPHGHRPLNGLLSLLGFCGERPDPVTGHYHLGNGYRPFNPVLMCFICPDSLSPFEEGGLNAYAYCGGDPVNRVDPTGHAFVPKPTGVTAKRTVLGVSQKSKTISRPLATSGDMAEGASSSSQNVSKAKLKRLRHNEHQRKYYAQIKERVDTIQANEASQQNQSYYNVSDDLRDLELSKQAYEHAQQGYGFKTVPDPTQRHVWIDPMGNSLLDVAHFDATISHFRNLANKSVGGRSYRAFYQLQISRAQYIKNFTPIDLMAVRQ